MINILAIRCSVAFAPYLALSAADFLSDGVTASRVVRQGGRSLILRSDSDLTLRHEHRQASLGVHEARHYAATVGFRNEFYDVTRMQDEVVLASVGDELLLSYPQSELWLRPEAVAALLRAYAGDSNAREGATLPGLPEWLSVSTGGARLLLSDQRTGRWVLLGDDHVHELKRRLGLLSPLRGATGQAPPTIQLKGLTVRLQSAFKLVATLLDFTFNANVEPFEETTPTYALKAARSTEGIELSDSHTRVSLTVREARKWADIIGAELSRLGACQVERGAIRTVFADHEGGRWILQWGDEVWLPNGWRDGVSARSPSLPGAHGGPLVKRSDEFLLALDGATGSCVALTDSESKLLDDVE